MSSLAFVGTSWWRCHAIVAAATLLLAPVAARAQQQSSQPRPQPSPQQPAPQPAQQPPSQRAASPPPSQSPPRWDGLPRMGLERQFAGPLQDTLIQRWRDPGDGTICYVYLPITAPHSQPTESSYVQYGPNGIGSISCLAAPSSASRR